MEGWGPVDNHDVHVLVLPHESFVRELLFHWKAGSAESLPLGDYEISTCHN